MQITDLAIRGEWTSASNAQADELCSARHLAQKGIPEDQSKDADHGRKIHDALRTQSSTGLDSDQSTTYDMCRDIEDRLVNQFFPEAGGGKSFPNREQRFWIQWADGLRHSGQVDSVHKLNSRALIVEYKTLPGEVAASNQNLQLRDQAALYDFNVQGLTEVGVVAIQPLVTTRPEITVYTKADLQRARDDMWRRIKASNTPGQPRIPGHLQCKFCRARTTCSEYGAWASSLLTLDTPKADAITIELLRHTPASLWNPQQRAIFMDCYASASKWLEERKEEIREALVTDPNAVPGYELKEGATSTTISNPEAVFARFLDIGGDSKAFMACVSVSKTELNDAVRSATGKKGKALMTAVSDVIGTDYSTSQNKSTIVRKK